MKCAAIKLSIRAEQSKRRILGENRETVFAGEEGHSYAYPFGKTKSERKNKNLAITNINLPDNVQGFNTGASLDRWCKKRVRLKSAKVSKPVSEFDKEFCYDTLEADFSILLNGEDITRSESLDNLQYEVHSDIEKLLEENGKNVDGGKSEKEIKRRRKKNREKKKSKIRFSQTPSPQTEQVIRVDVTSNVSTTEDKCRLSEIKKIEAENLKKSEEKDDVQIEKESSVDMCDEDFLVKCRQLALKQRRKRV